MLYLSIYQIISSLRSFPSKHTPQERQAIEQIVRYLSSSTSGHLLVRKTESSKGARVSVQSYPFTLQSSDECVPHAHHVHVLVHIYLRHIYELFHLLRPYLDLHDFKRRVASSL